MFNKLKKGFKDVVSKFSKTVEEEGVEVEEEKLVEVPEEVVVSKKEEVVEKEEKVLEPAEEVLKSKEKETSKEEEVVQEPKGIFGKVKEKIVTKKINEKQFEEMFWDLEVILLENNVALEVIDRIKENLKMDLVDVAIERAKVSSVVSESLKEVLSELLEYKGRGFLEKVRSKKPYVVVFFGINGSGKTTAIAKVAKLLKDEGLSCVLGAADTFRAGAEEQLKVHADKLGLRMIKHSYGSDPAAVAFDAKKYAIANGLDVVLVDTAGRLHSNKNLMEEMKKIVRVAEPDMKIFVGESITGNDCCEQARSFKEAIGIDGVVLTKADIDEKGGAMISVSFVTKSPIYFLGVGQGYDDLEVFDVEKILKGLGL